MMGRAHLELELPTVGLDVADPPSSEGEQWGIARSETSEILARIPGSRPESRDGSARLQSPRVQKSSPSPLPFPKKKVSRLHLTFSGSFVEEQDVGQSTSRTPRSVRLKSGAQGMATLDAQKRVKELQFTWMGFVSLFLFSSPSNLTPFCWLF